MQLLDICVFILFFYTHCFLVCLLHYVCDFIYTCFISCSLSVSS